MTLSEKYQYGKVKYVKAFYGYSDRGEFSCSAFIVGLAAIKSGLKLDEIFWTFTCPQHGKSRCDAEGAILKCCVKKNVDAGNVFYNPCIESYDKTIARLLNDKFVNKGTSIERQLFCTNK